MKIHTYTLQGRRESNEDQHVNILNINISKVSDIIRSYKNNRKISCPNLKDDNIENFVDKCKIINETNKTLQCEVQFNRRLINKKSYGSAKGIWISTNRDGIWALQIRSMIPVSGTISSLAGTNMNSS